MTLSSETVGTEAPAFEPARFGELNSAEHAKRHEAMSQTHGYATGYATGIRAAESVARKQREQIARAHASAEAARAAEHALAIEALQAAAQALNARTVPVLDAASTVLAEAALLLAQKIIGKELSNDAFGAKAALDRALVGIEAGTVREVRMNPHDLALLGLSHVPGTTIKLAADAALAKGDAMTAFDEGFLDARISTAFERAALALRGGS
ncbi:FliH/SctL family protein [Paeniglutamicibacter kerguelensis]|uniref:Flagellar assembly protein FliH n=1 Tax=Paeniglutamicibacter kerguelensis TaxID=254788 RepID=A0ABS4XEG3_9MICC|nr:FliH/SctL family protein [Paeniglutamicibacter kerguelensis]MBP2386854.1 flagellar assembly protein FliH [Paeniglutamicibacter kerguelensis]